MYNAYSINQGGRVVTQDKEEAQKNRLEPPAPMCSSADVTVDILVHYKLVS